MHMPTITIDGKPVRIEPLPATRRNELLLRESYEETQNWLEKNAVSTFTARLASVCEQFSELLQYVTPDGNYNRIELQRIAEMYAQDYADGDGNTLPMDKALEMATETVKTNYDAWLRENPTAARMLFFDAASWPATVRGRDKGIDILKRTANLAALADADLAQRIQTDEGVWLDATPEEVANYVNQFREKYTA
jgi:hypothetical protein